MLPDDGVVPLARFGAALHRSRVGSGESLASIARAVDGRFLPDQLVAIERGDLRIGDDDVAALVGPYGLASRGWPPASSLELVLDRVEVTGGARRPSIVGSHEEQARWIAGRFVSLSVLLGLDVLSGPVGLDVLAEAIEAPVDVAVTHVAAVLEHDAARIGSMIAAVEERIVVPEVGFLVGTTTTGSLLIARRTGGGGTDVSGRQIAAAGRLTDLLDAVWKQ